MDTAAGQQDVTTRGTEVGEWFGYSLATGDFDRDSVKDLLVGAPFGTPPGRSNAGQSYIIFGGALPSTVVLSKSLPAASGSVLATTLYAQGAEPGEATKLLGSTASAEPGKGDGTSVGIVAIGGSDTPSIGNDVSKILTIVANIDIEISTPPPTPTPVPIGCGVVGATHFVPGQFSTIQAAIDAAHPGDTISVGPGTYEHIVIDKVGLNVQSLQGNGSTAIEGQSQGGSGVLPTVVHITADCVTLRGFTINPTGDSPFSIYGVDVDAASQVRVLDNVIDMKDLDDAFENCISGGRIAFNADSTGDLTISGNTFRRAWMGMWLKASTKVSVTGNTVHRRFCYAVQVGGSSDVTMENNSIDFPGARTAEAEDLIGEEFTEELVLDEDFGQEWWIDQTAFGITIGDSSGVTLRNNSLAGDEQDRRYESGGFLLSQVGVSVGQSSQVTVEGTVLSMLGIGISVGGSSGVTVRENIGTDVLHFIDVGELFVTEENSVPSSDVTIDGNTAQCEGRRDNVPPGRSSAEVWRLKTVPPVAFNQERQNLIEGGLDVQGGDVPASSQGLLCRRDERSRGCAGIRTAPGHGAQDAQVLGTSRVSTRPTG